jgi:hypothetical protein
VVEEEGVLEGELPVLVTVHDSCIFNDINILWGPARGNVEYYYLLEEPPVAGEADEERGVSGTWGEGGAFHVGMEGSSEAEWAAAARGKLSTTGGLIENFSGLYFGFLYLGSSISTSSTMGFAPGTIPRRM